MHFPCFYFKLKGTVLYRRHSRLFLQSALTLNLITFNKSLKSILKLNLTNLSISEKRIQHQCSSIVQAQMDFSGSCQSNFANNSNFRQGTTLSSFPNFYYSGDLNSQLSWGSEIQPSLDFQWSKKGWVLNDMRI